MKTILPLCIIPILLTGCENFNHPAIPLNIGVCKDGTCLNVGVTIPARTSGKDAKEVQPVQ
jgi:hypothetical protein